MINARRVWRGERLTKGLERPGSEEISPDVLAKWESAARAVESAAREQSGEPTEASRLSALRGEVERGLRAARRDRDLIDALTDVRTSRGDLGASGVDDAYARTFRDAGLRLLRSGVTKT
jgi:hypothetical protein